MHRPRRSVLQVAVTSTASVALFFSGSIFNVYFVHFIDISQCLLLTVFIILCNVGIMYIAVTAMQLCTFIFGDKAMPYQCLRLRKNNNNKRGFLTLISEILDGDRPLLEDHTLHNENTLQLLYHSDTDSEDLFFDNWNGRHTHLSTATVQNTATRLNTPTHELDDMINVDIGITTENNATDATSFKHIPENSPNDDCISVTVSETDIYPEIPEERYTQSSVYSNLFAPAVLMYTSTLLASSYSSLQYLSFGVGLYMLSLQELSTVSNI